MRVLSFELGPFLARCVVVAERGGGEAIVVDPGFDAEVVVEEIRRQGVAPAAVVLTHAHLDHAYGVAEIKAAFPSARLLLHAADLPLYENLAMQAQAFGFPPPATPPPDGFLADGEVLTCGPHRLEVRHAPGHSPGHIVLIDPSSPLAIVGDVLFAGSVGRTDLWGGNFETLAQSIRKVLYSLPGHTRVVPGHGPETTIAAEATGNPFVRAL